MAHVKQPNVYKTSFLYAFKKTRVKSFLGIQNITNLTPIFELKILRIFGYTLQ